METPDEPESRPGLNGACYAFGLAVLLFQVAMIVHGRFNPGRYWSWAPHDAMWEFELSVELGDRKLSRHEARARYRIRRETHHEYAIERVIGAVRQYEMTYGLGDGARVHLTYRRNGRPAETWIWPEE